MPVADNTAQVNELPTLPFWYRLSHALFHVDLIPHECTVFVPRPGAIQFAGGQTNLHNGSRPCITARAVLINKRLGMLDAERLRPKTLVKIT